MAAIRETKNAGGATRISTSFTYTRIKEIQDLGLLAIHRTHSAGDESVASTSPSCTPSEKQERQHINLAEPCFITKRPGYNLERAHWINAVRHNPSEKVYVETFLKTLGVVRPGFNLNSATNLTPLDRTLHYTLDKLGFFAVTCSKNSLQQMLAIVERENRDFDQYNVRRFALLSPPFTDAEYEMVVLHPQHFLPMGAPITISTLPPGSARMTNTTYVIAADGALREGFEATSPRFGAFPRTVSRSLSHELNPFLVVLNAEMAFRRCNLSMLGLCDEYKELVSLTQELASAIYYQPIVPPAMRAAKDARELENSRRARNAASSEQAEQAAPQDVDEFGGTSENSEDRTITPRRRRVLEARNSRLGWEVPFPGADASHDELVDYSRYIMSGRDQPLSLRDEAVLASLGLGFYAEGDDTENSDEGDVSDDINDDWLVTAAAKPLEGQTSLAV